MNRPKKYKLQFNKTNDSIVVAPTIKFVDTVEWLPVYTIGVIYEWKKGGYIHVGNWKNGQVTWN